MGFSHCLPNIYREKNYIPDYSVKKERRTGQSRLKNQSTLSPSFSSLLFFVGAIDTISRLDRFCLSSRSPPPKKAQFYFISFFTGNGDLFLYFGGGTHRLLLLFWVGGGVCVCRQGVCPSFSVRNRFAATFEWKKEEKRVFGFLLFFGKQLPIQEKKYEARDTQRCKKIFL